MQLLLVLALAVIFFGPKRLPEIGRSLGSALREFKESFSGASAPKAEKDASAPDEADAVER
ncbi:MAG: twin-arginine translocase TatA/TatE family subunit [Clostridiales bacterium]|nr:twin-arginine translocase TatA/TatE family subunit [Clostridiales bacterium]